MKIFEKMKISSEFSYKFGQYIFCNIFGDQSIMLIFASRSKTASTLLRIISTT